MEDHVDLFKNKILPWRFISDIRYILVKNYYEKEVNLKPY